MTPLSALFTCLPFLTGGDWEAPTSEVGGRVFTEATVPPPGLPATVRLLDDQGQCVAEATTNLSGRYSLAVTPGAYFVQVLAGEEEQLGQRLRVQPGSWGHPLILPGALAQPDLSLIAPVNRVAGAESTAPLSKASPPAPASRSAAPLRPCRRRRSSQRPLAPFRRAGGRCQPGRRAADRAWRTAADSHPRPGVPTFPGKSTPRRPMSPSMRRDGPATARGRAAPSLALRLARGVLLLAGAGAVLLSSAAAVPGARAVARCDLDGTVDAGSAAYLSDCIQRARQDGREALLLRLDTPGGSLEAARQSPAPC